MATQSKPEGDEGCDGGGGEEVAGELVVAGGDAAEVLEAAEGVLDQVPVAIAALVVMDGPLAAPSAGDHGNDALVAQEAA